MMKKYKVRAEVVEVYTSYRRVLFRIVEHENMKTGEITYETKGWGIPEYMLKYKEEIEKVLANNKGKVIFVMIEDGVISKVL